METRIGGSHSATREGHTSACKYNALSDETIQIHFVVAETDVLEREKMVIDHFKAFRLDDDSHLLGLAVPAGEEVPSEWKEQMPHINKQIEKFKNKPPICTCKERVDLIDCDWIEENTNGNVGMFGDMVYFHTKEGDTVGIMMEIVLLHPHIFEIREFEEV